MGDLKRTLGHCFFLSLLISVLISGLIGLVLAQAGFFSLGSLLLALTAYSVFCLAFTAAERISDLRFSIADFLNRKPVVSPAEPLAVGNRKSTVSAGVRLNWEDAIIIFLFCLSLLLYASRPAEYILGWLDAGWYVNTGVHVAKTGSLSGESPVFSSLPPSAKPLFYDSFALLKGMFPYFPATESRGIYLWAFAVADPDKGALTAYHPPLFSVWIAIFYALGGLRFSLYATPFFGALAVLSLYFAAKAMFGRKVGLLAAVLLAISFTQIHFSRMPYSEILSQCLLFSGIYGLVNWETGRLVAWETGKSVDWGSTNLPIYQCTGLPMYQSTNVPIHAVIAALCFGQAALCRIDGLIAILPLVLFLGYEMILHLGSAKQLVSFVFPYGVILGDGVILASTSNRPYVELNFYGLWYKIRSLLSQSPVLLIASGILLGALLVLFALLGLLRPIPERRARWLSRISAGRHLITTFVALAILLAALYAYFVHRSSAGGSLAQLGQLLSPLGVWLGVVGLAELIRRDINEKTVFFLILMLLHGLATTSVLAISATPSYLYSARRQVPMLIPSLILLASYAILGWGANWQFALRSPAVRTWLRIAQGIAIGVLVISFLALAVPYLNAREMPNTIAFSERLANYFGEQDIVVFEETWVQESLVGHFAAPLWAIYDRNALLMSTANVEGEAFSAAMAQWLDAGRGVYFVSQSDPPPVPLTGYEFMLVAEDQWRSSTTTMLSAFPPKVLEFEIPFYIYQIVEGESL